MERNHELLTSMLFLVKVTFFDFSITFFIQNKDDEWFEIQNNKRYRNDNVAVLHTTSPRAFQRSQDDVNCTEDVKPRGLGLT